MRAVVQRVISASVSIDQTVPQTIGRGLVVFLGVGLLDSDDDARYVVSKISNLRIFADPSVEFNKSILDIGGDLMLVSQFTLYADTKKGRRPSFSGAAGSDKAEQVYNDVLDLFRLSGCHVVTGWFGQHMEVELINDGPVTILIDSAST